LESANEAKDAKARRVEEVMRQKYHDLGPITTHEISILVSILRGLQRAVF
jgi:hypothetical protein